MDKEYEYTEDFMSREFYNTYKKIRRKASKNINQYKYFEKAFNGLILELRAMVSESEEAVHLKGLGVVYRKPYGSKSIKVSILEQKVVPASRLTLLLEDELLREELFTKNPNNISFEPGICSYNPETIMAHRKLKLKK